MYIMDEVAHSQVEEMVNLVIMLVDVRIVLIDMVVFVNNSGKERYDVGCENVTATEQHVYETWVQHFEVVYDAEIVAIVRSFLGEPTVPFTEIANEIVWKETFLSMVVLPVRYKILNNIIAIVV